MQRKSQIVQEIIVSDPIFTIFTKESVIRVSGKDHLTVIATLDDVLGLTRNDVAG